MGKLNYKNLAALILSFCFWMNAHAQSESSIEKPAASDTSNQNLNSDGFYNRPMHSLGTLPLALGGYMEANTQYSGEDGSSDGFSFQFRRMSLFLSSSATRKIKFLTEVEFTPEEINIQYAAMDVSFHPLLNFRGGIILNPIGSFNQNHDGPLWDFVDRPISSTTILPATLSNVGFGFHGEYSSHNWICGYEAYLTNGFDEEIVSNTDNRTSLADGAVNVKKFEQSSSGLPMFTGKLSFGNSKVGVLGMSFMRGVFNEWKINGTVVDKKRNATVIAIDFKTSMMNDRLNITAEGAKVLVDVPETYPEQFGSKQLGYFVDVVGTVLKRNILGWQNAKINVGTRLDYADYNQDKFTETNGKIFNDVWAITPEISFRPVASTVLRFNYRYQHQRDLFGYPPVNSAAIQFGFSTYF